MKRLRNRIFNHCADECDPTPRITEETKNRNWIKRIVWLLIFGI